MKTEHLGHFVISNGQLGLSGTAGQKAVAVQTPMTKGILAGVLSIACCALLGLALMLVVAGGASATTCAASDYCSASGGSTAATQLDIGTVGTADYTQIGNVSLYNNSGTAPCCAVSSTQTSMWYEFYWAGGSMEIQGGAGNNGTDPT